MEGIKEISQALLASWCEGLYRHQVRGTGDARTDGAFICPSCGMLHGRSMDAIYPFMTMYRITGDGKWLDASVSLFDWAECVVSNPDGSYDNDIDSHWRGITVFALTAMMDTLMHDGKVIPDGFRERIEKRALSAASYLASHDEYKRNNINYPISIALALYLAGTYFSDDALLRKSAEYKDLIYTAVTENNLLFGEGIPREKISERGCRSVDIGYNTEESLPAIVRLAAASKDDDLLELSIRLFKAHLSFALPDGGWDNSFGTRSFKWTYWGSRTSDGAAAALLYLSRYDSSFGLAALRNLSLMRDCTHDNLLYGGPDLYVAGESACIHHTFTHAKIPAFIINEGLFPDIDMQAEPVASYVRHFPEIDTYRIETKGFSATATGYDWKYMKGGHASGGTLTMLHGRNLGSMLVSGMAEYSIKEANNQQIPSWRVKHECLALRVEDGPFSSLYCLSSKIGQTGSMISVEGVLCDIDGNPSEAKYRFSYAFSDDDVLIECVRDSGKLIMPVISRESENVIIQGNRLSFERGFDIIMDKGSFSLPYGLKRIFNLVPGFQALRIDIADNALIRIVRRKSEQDCQVL